MEANKTGSQFRAERGLVCLAIEASNPSLPPPAVSGVAVGILGPHGPHLPDGCVVAGAAALDSSDKRRDDLTPCIVRALDAAELKLMDVRCVAVSVGPGGFTSIRSAIAAGAMLAETLGVMAGGPIECRAVPSVLCAWFGLGIGADNGPVGVALASKTDTIFATVFSAAGSAAAVDAGQANGVLRYGEAVSGGIVTSADAERWVAKLAGGVLVADGHLPEAFTAAAVRAGVRIAAHQIDAASCLRAASVCPAVGADGLAAVYGREPEAVTIWRNRRLALLGMAKQ